MYVNHFKCKLVEVEIDQLSQLDATIEGGVDAILLDNFSPPDVALAVKLNQNRVILEASGGILLANLEDWRECGLDVLSTSTINRGTTPVDLSMLIEN